MLFDRVPRPCVAALLVLVALAPLRVVGAQPAAPTARDRVEARNHFQSGVAAYTRREWATALEEFQNAYRLAPHPAVRVNMANCFVELHRPLEALGHFEQFLSESPNATPAQRAAIEQQIRVLRADVGEIALVVTPADAPQVETTLDGNAASFTQPVRVTRGQHSLEVRAQGFLPWQRSVDVTGGATLTVDATLEAVAPPPRPPPDPPPAPVTPPRPEPPAPALTPPTAPAPPAQPGPVSEAPRGLRPGYFYTTLGVTAVSAVAWTVFGVLSLSANGDFDATASQVERGAGDLASLQAQGQDEASRARRFALFADIAMGATLVGAAATILLYTRTDFGPRVHVGAAPTAGGASLVLGGRF